MICNVIGKECLREDCRQWKVRTGSCDLRKKFGAFLYHPVDMTSLARFISFIEELGDFYASKR